MTTTNKKDMELYYALPVEDVFPVRLNTDEIVYISKTADMTGNKPIRMYKSNGRAIVTKRYRCKEYTPVMLHPANIGKSANHPAA